MELNRNETVYNDFFGVHTTDGTWSKESLKLEFAYPEGANDPQYIEFLKAEEKCANAILEAYVNGKLDNAGFITMSDPNVSADYKFIDFALRAKDIPDETWKILSENGQKHSCYYSYCLPAAHLRMGTYRNNCGCIGSSWETRLVEDLSMCQASGVNDIYHLFGNYAAALAVLKAYNIQGIDEEIAKIDGLTEKVEKLVVNASTTDSYGDCDEEYEYTTA